MPARMSPEVATVVAQINFCPGFKAKRVDKWVDIISYHNINFNHSEWKEA
jgi:hypothetical protein